MPALNSCSDCNGRFAAQYFSDYEARQVCRLCDTRSLLEQAVAEGNRRYEELKNSFKLLQEHVRNNVDVSHQPAVRPDSQTSSTLTAERDTPAAQSATAMSTSPDSSSPPEYVSFTQVRNGATPRRGRTHLPTTTCYNRFQILSDTGDDEDTEEIRLVGDSLCRPLLTEFCGRAPRSRRRYCIPGGGVDDVIAAVDAVSSQAPENTTYVIHVGTNDVQRTRSEELLDKYRKMMRTYKEKSNKVIVSGIIPRRQAGSRFYAFASSLNRRLENLCKEENVGFVSTWDNFYYDSSLFSVDGLHLSPIGAARFGRLLDDAVRDYRTKNGNALTRPASAE